MMRKGRGLFDVTMGAYDSAEIYELVGLIILYIFQQLRKKLVFTEMMGWQ